MAQRMELVRRAVAAGGKVYPPYTPVLSVEGWREHDGTSTWQRLAAARRRYDPNNILTPGAGVFA
jgi:cytokinin dehydrogenase